MMTQALNPAIPAFLAFITVFLLGRPTIAWLAGLKMRQTINTDAPKSHLSKQGTPTMGGVLFFFGVTVALALLWIARMLPDGRELYPLYAVYAVFAAHLGLGFLDDYLKATRGKSLGLKARQKLLGQFIIAAGFTLYLFITAQPGVTTELTVWREVTVDVSPYLYYPLVILVMIAMSNFTNLTDGLDGLAGGLAVLALVGLAVSIVPGYSVLSVFVWAFAGAVLGFLCFNMNPAKVFMGDTGSLALGSSFAAVGIMGKQELALFVFALVFVAEGVSVILQVISFKTTGKRIFKMAPLHHHFELLGWSEKQVVFRFWIVGAIALFAGLLAVQTLSPWRW
jgi:phospho-N-acetylmuramoyl-pentapeptide-transferase